MISTDPSLWIIRPKPNERARVRLYCFPFAGGAASIFHTWPHLFPTDIELCAIELPGRGRRIKEPLVKRLAPLVEATAAALQPDLDRPFAFFGHSMGALLCFELTRCLRRHNQPLPKLLAVSGRKSPQLSTSPPFIHTLPEPEFWAAIKQLGGTARAVFENEEMRQLFFPIMRADFTMIETYAYVPEARLDCAIAAYAGCRDPEVSQEQLEAWKMQTSKSFSMELFPGDHFYIDSSLKVLVNSLANQIGNVLSLEK
ncbi:thioesterase II family protein [Synechococcus sp. PCC 7336]|uniref:thioesterase II family protein n=1 Tax=Synechococcus sp. PCC 7336 TaxID=195250 RepID=UPI0003450D15|nr:alpha/beta fold hydrolase [Synechococcus sp. PCC 7336]